MRESEPSARPLQSLLAEIEHSAWDGHRAIRGITADSRDVEPGYLFVAVPGTSMDGHDFAGEAARRGAVAILAEHTIEPAGLPVIRVPDARRALAEIAAAWYDHPERDITLVGITGSLGKTSVLTMLETVTEGAGLEMGAIGSEIIGIRVQDHFDQETQNTTPDPITLHRGLRRIADEGAPIAAMEVTSHALDQERVHGVSFAAGIFTNLVRLEHLDYHGSFAEYVRTKLTFCDHLRPGAPLVYGADSHRLRDALLERDLNLVGCGFDDEAAIRIRDLRTTRAGTDYRLDIARPLRRLDGSAVQPGSIPVRLRLLGRPHVLNSAFAAAAALHLGVDQEAIRAALTAFTPPERRMQLVEVAGLQVLDDTAGHPDSVDAVFDAADQLPHRRLVVVSAIRGHRGPEINERLGVAIGRHCARRPGATLIATDSADAVAEPDEVSGPERQAFLRGLARAGADCRHLARLDEALELAVQGLSGDDLLVLIGAQGMRTGVERLREMRGTPEALPDA